MKQHVTKAIVLHRVNYGEADRILTVLTPDQGKLSLMAKGVRREKSKLAGGVELFSINEISYIPGRGEVSTLTSSRLEHYFKNITADMDKTTVGYDILKTLHKITESETERAYFETAEQVFGGMDSPTVPAAMAAAWFNVRILDISGHAPNLRQDTSGKSLAGNMRYNFSVPDSAFDRHDSGMYTANHIKLLRLLITYPLLDLQKVNVEQGLLDEVQGLTRTIRDYYL